MRIEGRLTRWNDERGFGFLTPETGGQDVFVHISAFPRAAARPVVEARYSFEIELDAKGKKRAKNVAPIRVARPARQRRDASPAQWGTATLFAIPAFVVLFLTVGALWDVPGWVLALYVGASVICFAAYAFDKSAAESGSWRTTEQTLHLLALLGGWPGALVAQQYLRHKSVKAGFRAVFWITVAMNVAAFVVLATPLRALLTKFAG